MDADAIRGRTLVEESREAVVVLGDDDRVLLASRRARQSIDGLIEGAHFPADLLTGERGVIPLVVPYEVGGRRERLVYLSREGDLAAYEELRAGFTAAVSHELRTPLARLLTLLETTTLPGEDVPALVDQARGEIDQITELIDEVLFLSELESGARVVALGPTPVRPVLEEAVEELQERAARAGVEVRVECADDVELAIRPRMLRVIAANLTENAIRYAGPGATFTLSVERAEDTVTLVGRDDGIGIEESELPRVFERFYRSDRARASRGTGLGTCDREAHRHAGGRYRRRARRARSRPGGSRGAARAVAPLHRILTTCSPPGGPGLAICPGHSRHGRRHETVLVTIVDETTAAPAVDSLKIGELAGSAATDVRSRDVVFNIDKLSVRYAGALALREATLSVHKNAVTAFIGPSGCGKSTFIRCLNRMNDEIPGATIEGEVLYHGRNLYAPEVDKVEVRRRIGMVFQKPNPFPKSIYDNIAFGPRMLGMKKDLDERVERVLKHAALWEEVKDRLKENALGLSGGQQQRLCIARALAVEPDVILMDEPASALDPISTTRIEDLIGELKRDYTIAIVTHNMQQAARVADMTAFFSVEVREDGKGRHGILVEYDLTTKIFTNPGDKRTEDYVTGRFG